MSGANTTKTALLEAGRQEFSKYGLAGARINRIAAIAGVNKERIYAYFDTKEGLFEAVIADSLASLFEAVSLPNTEPLTLDAITSYIHSIAAYHRAHPDLMRLLQWESLESTSAIDLTNDRAAAYRTKVDALARSLGINRDDAAALQLQLILLVAGPQALARLTSLLFDQTLAEAINTASTRTLSAATSLVSTYLSTQKRPD